MYYTRQDAEKKTRERVDTLRECAALIPQIKKVVAAFNGKVYNKRLPEAIQAATNQYISTERRGDYLSFYRYERGDCFTLLSIKVDEMPDGKRINAEQFNNSLNENRARLLKEAAQIEEQLQNIDAVIDKIEQLKKLYSAITSPLNSRLRDYYGIKYYIF